MARTPTRPGEFELIARYFAPLAAGEAGALGLADDAATIAPAPGNEFVLTADAVVENVHFLPDDPADLVARKALRVNLSDLAAKGAVPRAYLMTIQLPAATDEAWIAGFARGLAIDQAEHKIALLGGDTTATPGPLAISITALGEVAAGRMPRRSGACPGDLLYVSGTIGDAALGLRVRRGELGDLSTDDRAWLVRRYRLPDPRTGLGPLLVGTVSASIDVSDGLVADAGHIAETSAVRIEIDQERVPLSPAARAALALGPVPVDELLSGGDDYELLFSAPAAAAARIAAAAESAGVPVTVIGRVVEAATPGQTGDVVLIGPDGTRRHLRRGGWTHF